jgi:hypothetical protein
MGEQMPPPRRPNQRLPIGNIGINNVMRRIQPRINQQLQQELDQLANRQRQEDAEGEAQRIIELAEQERLQAQQQNNERYVELLRMVDEFIQQHEQANDNEFLDLYRRGRDIVVGYQQRNEQIPYDINIVLRQMISEMNVQGIVRRYNHYNITDFFIYNNQFIQSYSLALRNNRGQYFDQDGQILLFFNDNSARTVFNARSIELNYDRLNELTNQFNLNIFGELYCQNLNNILLDTDSLGYIYENLLIQRQGAGKSYKNRRRMNQYTKNKRRKNNKKTMKHKNARKKYKTKKMRSKR